MSSHDKQGKNTASLDSCHNDNGDYHDASYWLYSAMPGLKPEEYYKMSLEIITASELLERWSSLEPFELALFINDEISNRLSKKFRFIPRSFFLVKIRNDDNSSSVVHCLQFIYKLFPFKYHWDKETISFDFTGIVFDKSEIIQYEHDKPELLNLKRIEGNIPGYYPNIERMKELFPVHNQMESTDQAEPINRMESTEQAKEREELEEIQPECGDDGTIEPWRSSLKNIVTLDRLLHSGQQPPMKKDEAKAFLNNLGVIRDQAFRDWWQSLPDEFKSKANHKGKK